MNKVSVIAVDLAKNVFQLAGEDAQHELVLEKTLKSRQAMHNFIKRLEPSMTVVMEAGPGAQAWAREVREHGAQVVILPAEHTAAHRSGPKNDAVDARAILRAWHDPYVHPVPIKTPEQLAMQALHRARQGWIGRRTAIGNQVRGIMLEQGIVIAKGHAALQRTVQRTLENAELPIPDLIRETVAELMGEWDRLGERVDRVDGQLKRLSQSEPVARHLCQVRGVGKVNATALACKGINPAHFANGRQFAAYLGVTPRQHSSGNRIRLGKMTKCGDAYLRANMIEGAHSVIRRIRTDATDPYSRRIQRWVRRCGTKGAAVRLANRNLRIIWLLLKYPQMEFQSNPGQRTRPEGLMS